MKTIAIIAPTGMLGSAVYGVLHDRYQLVLVLRDPDKLPLLDKAYGGVSTHRLFEYDFARLQSDYVSQPHGFLMSPQSPALADFIAGVGDVDAIVNAAGITNRYSMKDPTATFFINSALPQILSEHYTNRLIHITTDCVFNGVVGAPYTEESPKSPYDLYGLSKSLGEPAEHSFVMRTSIIGPEIAGFVSLISWVRQQNGKTIPGFTKHLWNGITTKQFGRIVDQIVTDRANFPKSGLFHIFGSDVTKYDMVQAIAKKYGIDANVEPDDTTALDRRLRTVHPVNHQLGVPTFETMLNNL